MNQTLSEFPLVDLLHQDPQVVEVDGFSVDPNQACLCHNQPLFFDTSAGQWCTFSGTSSVGLTVRYLDGSYAYGVRHTNVLNLGIQA